VTDKDVAAYFDRAVCCRPRWVRPLRVSAALIEALTAVGVCGLSVLELGCGTGTLAVELAARGAGHVTGIDLSERSVTEARRRAESADLADRTTFVAGNAASDPYGRHDVVVHDKLLCCYPDAGALMSRSLAAAGSVYAMSLPCSNGLRGFAARASFAAENGLRRLRGEAFRAYIHDLSAVDVEIARAGFFPHTEVRRGMWRISVYRRGAAPAPLTAPSDAKYPLGYDPTCKAEDHGATR
jgi:magnesium-protoporphyrin O-methyltransferase